MSRNFPCRVTPSTSVPGERRQRRVVGLEGAERRDVDADDGAVRRAGRRRSWSERLDLGQLGHGASLGGSADPVPLVRRRQATAQHPDERGTDAAWTRFWVTPPRVTGGAGRTTRFDSLAKSTESARRADTFRAWTRSGTPTPPAPASDRPSSPAATGSCAQFEVTLERVAAGRPERQHGALRAARRRQDRAAQRAARPGGPAGLGDRQDRGPPRPVGAAADRAGGARGRPRGRPPAPRPRPGRRGRRRAQVVRAAHRAQGPQGASGWSPPTDVPATKGRADSGDLELDLVELFTDVAELARDLGVGIGALRRRDAGHRRRRARRALRRRPRDQPAGRAAGRRRRRAAAPAGRARGAASRTPSGSSATSSSTGCPARWPTVRAWSRPAAEEGVDYDAGRARRALRAHRRLPVLRPGLRQGHLGRRGRSARSGAPTCEEAAPEAEARAGGRASSAPATTGPPRPSATTCAPWPSSAPTTGDGTR